MVEDNDNDLRWWHLALCQGMNDRAKTKPGEPRKKYVDKFYEGYEDDEVFAKVIDSICEACPVRAMCLREGIENREYGVWGGIYLTNGKMDTARNAHKTDDQWEEIRRLLSEPIHE